MEEVRNLLKNDHYALDIFDKLMKGCTVARKQLGERRKKKQVYRVAAFLTICIDAFLLYHGFIWGIPVVDIILWGLLLYLVRIYIGKTPLSKRIRFPVCDTGYHYLNGTLNEYKCVHTYVPIKKGDSVFIEKDGDLIELTEEVGRNKKIDKIVCTMTMKFVRKWMKARHTRPPLYWFDKRSYTKGMKEDDEHLCIHIDQKYHGVISSGNPSY